MAIEWLTVTEIAEELKVPPERVRSWIRRKELTGYRIGGRDWRVKREDLNRFIEESSNENEPEDKA